MGPPSALGKRRQAFPNLAERQYAQVQKCLVHSFRPGDYAWLGLDADELRNAIRVEQEATHSSTSLPSSLSRSKLSSNPDRGDSRKNSTMLFGCRDRLTRWL